jgi:hypothetical protein
MRKIGFLFAVLAFASQAACAADTGSAPTSTEETGAQASASTPPLYRIRNAYSGECLNVLNWGTWNGADIVQALDCNEASSHWSFRYTDSGYYNIVSFADECVNVLNYGFHNGDNVVQALDCAEWSSQWKLIPVGNGSYQIQARHDGQYLNVLNWGNFNGAEVVQAVDGSISTSHWYLEPI